MRLFHFSKKNGIATMSILAMLAVSCQKEDNLTGRINIFTESLNGSKVAIDGLGANWDSGDQLRINDKTKTIAVAEGNATVDNTSDVVSAPFHSIFPASLCPSANLSGFTSIDITIPSVYHYQQEGDGKQKLDIPMAAAADEGNTLQFKHITGALAIGITNNFGGDMTVTDIIVQSSVSQISGLRTIDFSDITTQSANDISVSEEQRQVQMLFDETSLVVANNSTKDIVIPVLPVSSSNKFTVTVNTTYGGKKYSFSKSQNNGGALGRNQMGYVPVTMSASNSDVSILISNTTDYNNLVTYINGLTSGTTTVRVTIDGTIDFGGASVTPINARENNIILNGTHNATIKNLTMTGVSNCYGLTYSFSPYSTITINDLTVEDITLPGNNGTTCYTSAICAYTKGNVTLNNCTVKNITIGQASQVLETYFGGLIGFIFVNNANSAPLIVNIQNCNYYQDETLINPSITRLSQPTIGGFIGQISENNEKVINVLINNSRVSNSTDAGFNLPLNLVSGSYSLYLGGIIGNCAMPSISSDYTNLQIKNTTSKINFSIQKTSSNTIYTGGFIGRVNTANYPSTTYWNGNNVSGSITYTNVGTNNVKKVIGNLNDNDNWSGRITHNVTISTL